MAEFLSVLPDEDFVILADPGPMGTKDCMKLIDKCGKKFLLCISLQKQFPLLYKKFCSSLKKGEWTTLYSEKCYIIIWHAKASMGIKSLDFY